MDSKAERPAITDDISNEQLIARYLEGPALVRETVAGMDEAQLHAKPVEGKMSTHAVVTHIVDSEKGLGGRVRRALAGEEAQVSAGAHPEIVGDPSRELGAELDTLDAARAELAAELRAASPDAWDRVALRREERAMTVRQVVTMMTRHVESHVAAIEEKKAALGL